MRGISNCSRNHFISVKNKPLQLFKLHFLHTCLPATVKVLEIFLEAILWSLFSSSVAFLYDAIGITKAPSFECWFQSTEQVTFSWTQGRSGGYSNVFTLFFVKKSLTITDRCAGALSWRRNQLLFLQFSGRFLLTACLRRWRKSMYISLFTVIMRENSCKLYQRISGTSWSYYVLYY